MTKRKTAAAKSSAVTVFPWHATAEVLGKLRAAGGSLTRLQFSGRHFERGQFAEIFSFLEQERRRFAKLDSFLFPGVMLRDDQTFDLIFRFLRGWGRLRSVQFERGSFLSKRSIENALLLPCRERLSLRFASSGSVSAAGGPPVRAKKMWLDFCGITPASLKALLPRLSDVTELDLCRNALGAAGGKVLASWKGLHEVECLDLLSTDLGDAGAHAICAALSPRSKLQTLYLGQNGITEAGVPRIVDALRGTRLRTLSLAANALHGNHVLPLVQQKNLIGLNVGNNPLKDAFLLRLAEALRERQAAGMPPMELNLAEIKATPRGWRRFFRTLADNATELRALSIEHDSLDEAAREALIVALKSGFAVRQLNVSQNELTARQIRALLRLFAKKKDGYLYTGYLTSSQSKDTAAALEEVMREFPTSRIPECLIWSRIYAAHVSGVPATVANLFLFSATSVPTSELRRCLVPPSGRQLLQLYRLMPANIRRAFACHIPALQFFIGKIRTKSEANALCHLLFKGSLQSLNLRTPSIRLEILKTILARAAHCPSLKELVIQSSFDPRIIAGAAASIRKTLARDPSLLNVTLVGLDSHLVQTKTKLDPAFGNQGVMSFRRDGEAFAARREFEQ
ncbi:MAG: hypothetical protein ACKPB4_23185, partial [Sphaerospermopsis kisseleviana]